MLVKVYRVRCDAPGCGRDTTGASAQVGRSGDAARRARTTARRSGWRRIGGRDLCPWHVAFADDQAKGA